MSSLLNSDLLDEVNCADSCEAVIALCELVDNLIKEIQNLELECISTRYLLSEHMDEDDGALLRDDILENLSRRFRNDPAYELYRNLMYDGGDPMEFHNYLIKVRDARNGNWSCWH